MTDAERAREIVRRSSDTQVVINGVAVNFIDKEGADLWSLSVESAIAEALAAVRAEERERAARAAERLDGLPETYHAPVFRHLIADAIRAGGST